MQMAKRLAAAIALICGAGAAQAQDYTAEHDMSSGNFPTINREGRYRAYQSGSYAANVITISMNNSDSVTLYIQNLNINATSMSPIIITGTGAARICIVVGGVNKLASSNRCAIRMSNPNASLTITAPSLYDTLKATGGTGAAGIGTESSAGLGGKSITIAGGAIVAQGGRNAAGIGTGYISGTSADINENVIENIIITGGSVSARGGDGGAGIGTGNTYMTSPNNPPSNEVTRITITGGRVYAIGGDNGAGIGTGYISSSGERAAAYTKAGSIKISGGYVNSLGGVYAAAIGTGYTVSSYSGSPINQVDSILVSGGEVISAGGSNSASVGAGSASNVANTNNIVKNVVISGGSVDAASTAPHYVDIGVGHYSRCGRIIISGGNVKAYMITGDLHTDPKNSEEERVYMAILNQANIITLNVDGSPYRIGGSMGESYTYLYLPYANATDSVHTITGTYQESETVQRSFNVTAKWDETTLTFKFEGFSSPTSRTTTQITGVPGYNLDSMRYSSAFKIGISTVAGGTLTSAGITDYNKVVIKIDGTTVIEKTVPTGEWPGAENGFGTIDLFQTVPSSTFVAGQHTLLVGYGGNTTYQPSEYQCTLTIIKAPSPLPPVQATLTAVYGETLDDIVLFDSRYEWQTPGAPVGNVGINMFNVIYCLDTNNYDPHIYQQAVNVTKATPVCPDPDHREILGTMGAPLRSVSIGDAWRWETPDVILRTMGEYEYRAVSRDTSNYVSAECWFTVVVMPSTGVPLKDVRRRLTAYPNPIFTGKTLNVEMPDGERVSSIEIYSILGSLVRQYPVLSHDPAAALPLDIPNGIYIVRAGSAAATIVVF